MRRHIAVVAINVVEDAVAEAEEVIKCGAYFFLEGVQGVHDLSPVGRSFRALEEVVVVFVGLAACATLALFLCYLH